MKRETRNNACMVALSLALVIGNTVTSEAAGALSSHGKLVFHSPSGSYSDVVFDAKDFETLASVCE